jgi:hypothetical protein
MQMKNFLIIFYLLFISCSQQRQQTDADKMFKWLASQKDPLANNVPDSLRYLLPVLDSVWYNDQKYRVGVSESVAKQKQFLEHAKELQEISEKNIKIVSSVLHKYGWLGPKDIGIRGNLALFLTIQHADIKTQEIYLPMIKKAVKDKKVLPSQYAMLFDRIELRNHRPQVYGTQVALISSNSLDDLQPLLNPDSVDAWRRSIGLDSLKSYLKKFHIVWDSEAYKQILPGLKKKYEITN